MKKKLLQMTAILTAVLALSGCRLNNPGTINNSNDPQNTVLTQNENISGESVNLTEGKGGAEIELVSPEEADIKALNDAALALLAEIGKNSEGQNVLLSPTSIEFALGMTANGADGETLKQLENTVNGGIDYEKMNSVMAYTSDKLRTSQDVNWNVANSIWFKDDGDWKMKNPFLNDVVNYYRSEVYKAPFDQQTVADINSWVNKETYGMIPDILENIPDEARMYLINAIAFEGEWLQKYEESDIEEGKTFTNADGSESEVTMLYSNETRYFTLADGEGFVKPYEGGEYSFVGILPKEGMLPEEYIKKLSESGENFAEAVKNAGYEEVRVRIPEFKLDYDIELSETYKAMGMELPFDQGNADFSKMMETVDQSPSQIWIGKILHKTHIEVDRKGTKAAAVTAVEMDAVGAVMMPQEVYTVYLDRPFVYAIVDNETGLPIFMGCQNYME